MTVLRRFIPEKVRIFVDDGVILGPRGVLPDADDGEVRDIVRDHIRDVIEVLRCLSEAGLTISGTKTFFGAERVEVLGYLCSPVGRQPADCHHQAIAAWKPPKDVSGVRRFIAT
ncbi:hypothetical protein GQ54DRAFT_267264, partial [Martensiomyces pterosporus]